MTFLNKVRTGKTTRSAGKAFLPICLALSLAACAVSSAKAQGGSASHGGDLKVFFVDVEGGQATLFVSPTGQSLLIDTGWPGNNGRDADRIAAAAKKAGVSKLDYVLLTHYHEDHAGGVPQLVARLPVGTFLDHGPNREVDHGIIDRDFAEYQKVLAAGTSKRIVEHPGDTLPITGMSARVISSDGQTLSRPLPGAGEPNPFCRETGTPAVDQTENSRSLGVEISFAGLKILDLGDLTKDKEVQLMCPNNRLGRVDILIVSHHGWEQSSSPALVEAIHPRVAIMDNGEKKGGSTPVFKTLAATQGLETLWQLHSSAEAGPLNAPAAYIANLLGTDPGNYLELLVAPNGSFQITNSRTGATKAYAKR